MRFRENDLINDAYRQVILQEAKKPSAGLTKKQKSAVAKKARAGKDIGKKGPGFAKMAKAVGGGEKGQKIAAAAMWKSIKRESFDVNESESNKLTDIPLEKIRNAIASKEGMDISEVEEWEEADVYEYAHQNLNMDDMSEGYSDDDLQEEMYDEDAFSPAVSTADAATQLGDSIDAGNASIKNTDGTENKMSINVGNGRAVMIQVLGFEPSEE
jgi:hypothetical protein